jgi:membrane-bound lytic murein transglycosylase D
VRINTHSALSILLISLSISACSTVTPPVAETAPPLVLSPASRVVVNEPVIENLVTAARQLGTLPVPTVAEEDGEAVVEPLTTTVPMTANRLVELAINDFLQNRRSVLRTWARRGNTYFPMIEKIFAEEGIPDELKYLALQESSLYPTIRSTAGAVGMWQFMSATAQSEGLRVDAWVDERRDPEKATRAAAKHLKALNESYQGSWHLSLAGYNCSYRCISRAAERAGGSIENPPGFWEIYPHLPEQTREFVPRFIAASLIVSNPEMYGIYVEDLGQELAYDVVKVEGMLSLEDAAKFAGTDVATIRALNPALLKGSLPEGPNAYELKIPLQTYDRFVAEFNRATPQGVPGAGEYVVKSGDTLDRIARQHSVSVDELRTANNIEGSLIRVKQKLLLPGVGSKDPIRIADGQREFVAYGTAEFKPIKLGDEFKLVQQSGSAGEEPLMAVSLNLVEPDEGVMSLVPTIYKVQSGDTLGAIARRYGVSVSSIQQNNRIAGNTIFPSQELTIHSAANVARQDASGQSGTTYQVQNGDSLYQIARRFKVSVDNLKRWNGLRDNVIYPGQSLTLN